MNPILQEIYETNLTTTPDGSTASIAGWSVDRNEAEFLCQVVTELQPTVTLEVGLAYGVSALSICEALPKTSSSRHIIIDPFQNHQPRWAGIGLHNLRRAGFEPLIEFYETYSYRALPQLESQGEQIEFAFIDGWHTFDFTFVDFFYVDKLLCQGGIVVFDDSDWPSVRQVIRYVVTNLPYRVYKRLPAALIERSTERKIYESVVDLGSLVLNGLCRLPGLNKPIRRAFGAELLGVDKQYGLAGSCIALQKVGKDEREVDDHVEF